MTKKEALFVIKNAAFLGTAEDAAKVVEAIDTLEGNVQEKPMDGLISRQAVLDFLDCFRDWMDKYGDANTHNEMAEYRAKALPAVDAAPVVRCQNCKYVSKERSSESARKFGQLYHCGLGVLGSPKADDFCSCGERMEE